MKSSRLLLLIGNVVLYLALSCAPAEAKKPRKWNLWGGQVTLSLPSNFKLQSAGENAYLVLSQVSGSKPRVITLQISRALGNAEPDWSDLVTSWQLSFQWDPTKKVIVPPSQSGSTFNVEYTEGSGRSSSRVKLRGLHRARANDLDFYNSYAVSMTAVPSSAWQSSQGKSLVKAFNSVRVNQ